ncbi:MAG: glycosyltransferase family 2 protein [Bacteroidales bacterium]|nr:glycosyltransferase family 2 protein [Bacteroidales bacterium]
MLKIAVIITCHNRKHYTLDCLAHLFKAREEYNVADQKMKLFIFLTDDGCTDGTSTAVNRTFLNESIEILNGNGNLYWAGGMRMAWSYALNTSMCFDYFLLLNDDTMMEHNAFEELFRTQEYCIREYGKSGIITGLIAANDDRNVITYGGKLFDSRFKGTDFGVGESSVPQLCDMANSNIMLVPAEVVSKIGIFYSGYVHAAADYDYSIRARRKRIPVLATCKICGRCDYDHPDEISKANTVISMTLSERKNYFKNPVHLRVDYLTYIRRTAVLRYPGAVILNYLNIYFPKCYYILKGII